MEEINKKEQISILFVMWLVILSVGLASLFLNNGIYNNKPEIVFASVIVYPPYYNVKSIEDITPSYYPYYGYISIKIRDKDNDELKLSIWYKDSDNWKLLNQFIGYDGTYRSEINNYYYQYRIDVSDGKDTVTQYINDEYSYAEKQ